MAKVNELHLRVLKAFLMTKALARRTTTYEEIATVLELPTSGNALGASLSPLLGAVYRECVANEWPKITSIVVRKSGADARLPGSGFWALLEHEDKVEWATLFSRERKRELTTEFQLEVWIFAATHFFDGTTYRSLRVIDEAHIGKHVKFIPE